MPEYIERERLFEQLNIIADEYAQDGSTQCLIAAGTVVHIINDVVLEAPTEDVQGVVYCKECKHLYCCSAVDRRFYCRHIHGMKGCLNPIEEKPFCSYGERIGGDKE